MSLRCPCQSRKDKKIIKLEFPITFLKLGKCSNKVLRWIHYNSYSMSSSVLWYSMISIEIQGYSSFMPKWGLWNFTFVTRLPDTVYCVYHYYCILGFKKKEVELFVRITSFHEKWVNHVACGRCIRAQSPLRRWCRICCDTF